MPTSLQVPSWNLSAFSNTDRTVWAWHDGSDLASHTATSTDAPYDYAPRGTVVETFDNRAFESLGDTVQMRALAEDSFAMLMSQMSIRRREFEAAAFPIGRESPNTARQGRRSPQLYADVEPEDL